MTSGAAHNWVHFTGYRVQGSGIDALLLPNPEGKYGLYPLVLLPPEDSVAPRYAKLCAIGMEFEAAGRRVSESLTARVISFTAEFGLLGISGRPYESGSPREWRKYGESLLGFLDCACQFAHAFNTLALYKQPASEMPFSETESALGFLRSQAGQCELLCDFLGTELFLSFAPPTLISLLALEALSDLSGRRNVTVCCMCKTLVFDRNAQRIYCSARCANRNAKRMERARKRKQEKEVR